jgi:hypothetical protein
MSFVQFERLYYWQGFVPESTANTCFFRTELRKGEKCSRDGRKSICGSKTSVVRQIGKEVIQVGSETPMVFQSIIHQEAPCCQSMSLKNVTDIVISTEKTV